MTKGCCVIYILILFPIASLASAQDRSAESTKASSGTNQDVNTVDCSKFGSSPGCKSFNEMVGHKDKGLLDSLGDGDRYAFICFHEDEDSFFVFEVGPPYEFRPAKGNPALEESSLETAAYSKYERGVFSDFRPWIDHWRKTRTLGSDSETFQSTNRGSACFIDSAEVVIGFRFQNVKGTQTDYTLHIRRSTGRFVETFATKNAQGPGVHQFDQSGYCEKRSPRHTYPPPIFLPQK